MWEGLLLYQILMKTHREVKSFGCTECGKAFITSSSLREHMKTHSEEKPYQCQQCGKAFRYPRSLQGHMITHSEEKPYECLQCEKAYRCLISLQRHMKIHSGEKFWIQRLWESLYSPVKAYKCEQSQEEKHGKNVGKCSALHLFYTWKLRVGQKSFCKCLILNKDPSVLISSSSCWSEHLR